MDARCRCGREAMTVFLVLIPRMDKRIDRTDLCMHARSPFPLTCSDTLDLCTLSCLRIYLFQTRKGDEKDDKNSPQRFGVLHLLQGELLEGSVADFILPIGSFQ